MDVARVGEKRRDSGRRCAQGDEAEELGPRSLAMGITEDEIDAPRRNDDEADEDSDGGPQRDWGGRGMGIEEGGGERIRRRGRRRVSGRQTVREELWRGRSGVVVRKQQERGGGGGGGRGRDGKETHQGWLAGRRAASNQAGEVFSL